MLLALTGVGGERRRILPLGAGAVFTLLLAIGPGMPLIRSLWSLPPFSLLRYPGRALPVFLCLGFALAALAWERMLRDGVRPARGRVLLVAGVLAAGLLAFALQAGDVVSPGVAAGQMAVQIAPLVVVAAWPAVRARRKAWEGALVTSCVLQAAPLFVYYGEFVQPRRSFQEALWALRPVYDAPPEDRGVAMGGMQPFGSQQANPPSLGNGATLLGARVVNEYNQFTWGAWRAFMRRTLHRYATGRETPPPSPPLSDLLGIRWLYYHESLDFEDPAWRKVGGDGGMSLWRRTNGAGSASFADRVVRRARPDVEEMVTLVREGTIDFRKTVILEDARAPDAVPPAESVAALIVEEEAGPNRFRFEVEAPTAGYLVVRDHDAPGWSARVDDVGVRHYRANAWFKAVPVPAGQHTVELQYRPKSFAVGAKATVIGWVAAFAMMATCLLLRRRRGAFP
jgi:hypothetical protein